MNPVLQIDEPSLQDTAKAILEDNAHFDVGGLDVEIAEECLRLSGTVRTFYHKQLVQELLRNLARARSLRIDNRLHVLELPSR